MKVSSDREGSPGDVKRRPARIAKPRRSLDQIAEGVRRQREHIMLLDGADPLRGGVAD